MRKTLLSRTTPAIGRTLLLLAILVMGISEAWADNVPTPYYKNDFSTNTSLTQVGSGGFINDADNSFGQIYHNDPSCTNSVRTNYLLLPSTGVLDGSTTSKAITIAFWVNAKNAKNYFHSPLFSAYSAAPDATNGNGSPMFICQARGLLQINNNGWCDFAKEQNDAVIAGTATDNAESTTWLDDGAWHYYTVTMTETKAIVYIDGEVMNSWTVDNSTDGQVISGLFTNPSGLKYICLGGNQAWNWSDPDPAFGFDDFAVYSSALTQDQIRKIMVGKAPHAMKVTKTWDFTTASWDKSQFGSNTTNINNVECTYATGALEGLALQGGSGTSWEVNANGLIQGNGDRNIAVLDLKAGDIVTVNTATTLSSLVNGTNPTGVWTGTCSFHVTADGALGFTTTRQAYITSISVSRVSNSDLLFTCEKPTATITNIAGNDGKSRKFTLACATANTEIYYSESELTTATGGTKYEGEVTTSASTIYAYAKTPFVTSEVMQFSTGTGTQVTLNAPVVTVAAVSQDGTLYKPTSYNITSDQSSVLGAPAVTYSYKIGDNGTETALASGTAELPVSENITIYAKATGYVSASVNLTTTYYKKDATVNYTFDSSSFTSHNNSEVADSREVNGVMCKFYSLADNAVNGFTLSGMTLAWATQANQAYCLYNRAVSSGATVTYNTDIPSGDFLLYTSASGVNSVSTSKTITVPWYGDIRSLALMVPVTDPIYTITCNTPENGTLSCSQTVATAGTEITIIPSANKGYALSSTSVTDASSNDVTVTDQKFTMPSSNVTVSATFTQKSNIVGSPDNTTVKYGAVSTSYALTTDKKYHITFKNYSDKTDNWHNWLLALSNNVGYGQDGYTQYLELRADNYGTGDYYNPAGLTSAFNWTTFKDDMDGATVDMYLTLDYGRLNMTSTITTTGGTVYNYAYQSFTLPTASSYNFFLSVDHSFIEDLSVSSESYTSPYTGSKTVKEALIGLEDNTTAWWTTFSKYYTVKSGQMAVVKFKNYSNKAENWNNWNICFHQAGTTRYETGYTEYMVLRADGYGWNGTNNTNDNKDALCKILTNNFGSNFKEDMYGADVELRIYPLNNCIVMEETFTTTGGTKYTQTFVSTEKTGMESFSFFLSPLFSHMKDLETTIYNKKYTLTYINKANQVESTGIAFLPDPLPAKYDNTNQETFCGWGTVNATLATPGESLTTNTQLRARWQTSTSNWSADFTTLTDIDDMYIPSITSVDTPSDYGCLAFGNTFPDQRFVLKTAEQGDWIYNANAKALQNSQSEAKSLAIRNATAGQIIELNTNSEPTDVSNATKESEYASDNTYYYKVTSDGDVTFSIPGKSLVYSAKVYSIKDYGWNVYSNISGLLNKSGYITDGSNSLVVSWPACILNNDKLYFASKYDNMGWYSDTIYTESLAEDYKVKVRYTDSKIAGAKYYYEAEDIADVTTSSTYANRASNGLMAYTNTNGADNYKEVMTLPAGTYAISARGMNGNTPTCECKFKVGDNVVYDFPIVQGTDIKGISNSFTIDADATLSVSCTGNSKAGLDYFYILQGAVYDITCNTPTNGTLSSSYTKITAGTEITLSISAERGYKLSGVTVKDASDNDVTVTDNSTFIMPESAVTVTATFEMNNDIVGNADDTSEWQTASSTRYTVGEGKRAHVTFKNYSSKAETYHNWVLIVNKKDVETFDAGSDRYFALRNDNYGWGTYYDEDNLANTFNWDTFKDDMDDSSVDMYIYNKGGEIYVTSNITTAGGTAYAYCFNSNNTSAKDFTFFFTVEKSHIEGLTVSVDDMPDAEEWSVDFTTMTGNDKDAVTVSEEVSDGMGTGTFSGSSLDTHLALNYTNSSWIWRSSNKALQNSSSGARNIGVFNAKAGQLVVLKSADAPTSVTNAILKSTDSDTRTYLVMTDGTVKFLIPRNSYVYSINVVMSTGTLITRSTATGSYGTICLPYAATSEGVVLFKMGGKVTDGIQFDYVGGTETSATNASLEAGVPYLYRATADVQKFVITGTTKTDATTVNGFVGNYTKKELAADEYFLYKADSKFHPAKINDGESSTHVILGAYHCYIPSISNVTDAASNAAKACIFGIYGEETMGINTFNADVDTNLADGKYAKNGHVIIVRNGKKYYTTGLRLK